MKRHQRRGGNGVDLSNVEGESNQEIQMEDVQAGSSERTVDETELGDDFGEGQANVTCPMETDVEQVESINATENVEAELPSVVEEEQFASEQFGDANREESNVSPPKEHVLENLEQIQDVDVVVSDHPERDLSPASQAEGNATGNVEAELALVVEEEQFASEQFGDANREESNVSPPKEHVLENLEQIQDVDVVVSDHLERDLSPASQAEGNATGNVEAELALFLNLALAPSGILSHFIRKLMLRLLRILISFRKLLRKNNWALNEFGDANCEESIVSPPKGDMAQNLEQTTLENLEHIRRETPEAQVSNKGDEHDVVPHIGVMPEPFNALEPLRSEPANADLPEPINTVEPLRSEPANADLPEPINTVEPLRSEPANADPVQVSTPRESAVVDGKGENSQGMEDNFRYVSFEDIVNVASSAVKESTVSQTPPIL
ncbi:uncharacterized protein LOC132047412 [Lycium ferocissimum]|uniref:uncharacterized protein LOC132047412 n=1 Tax=Lycium ferocissimum TaxID=112874 RepID=UPI002815526D|nr:uncharacterized protein LOC132047412 [Lycium ferocissimum]